MAACVEERERQFSPAVVMSGPPGPPTAPPQGVLEENTNLVVTGLNVSIDTLIFRLLTSVKTATEFNTLREELFGEYCGLAGTVGSIIKSKLGDVGLAGILEDSFASLETSILEDRRFFSEDDPSRDEALFSLDMLHRAHALLCQISHSSVPCNTEHDAKLIQETLGRIWWAQLHLRCIVYAMRTEAAVPTAEVKEAIIISLRIALLAYSSVREAWGNRFEVEETITELEQVNADIEEDQYLANEAEREYGFLMSQPSVNSPGMARTV